ncbi:MAG: aminomethyl-transferring glycine dehydrogenase subunit GcvPB [Alphaproteobacteria bacterium]|nr:aminomethyl-transferring glycine dehydrogenase subunit GcvPB [Alphaproteobacteria bacterium]
MQDTHKKAFDMTADLNSHANTQTGNRGLQIEEPLIFEQDSMGHCGVDWPDFQLSHDHLGNLHRSKPIGLPGLSEPQIVRHYTRLSQKNYAIDMGLYPLGSCTMKHNPRLNEKIARLPGLADLHPLQPLDTVQGALEIMDRLAHWLKVLTGMPSVSLSPAAGAHGELCGMMAIKAALDHRGEKRHKVLVAESAHGTNPATAAACGFDVEAIPAGPDGQIDFDLLLQKLTPDVAALMLTNPNTCGLFEKDIIKIAKALHDIGAFFYCDGANFNAIVGKVRPGDLGIDCMHINLHKTFSTPHGGGGPGSGPVVFSEALAPFVPLPYVIRDQNNKFCLIEHNDDGHSVGRLKAFHGQMGMFIRALTYMLSHGADGLKQVAEDAVLNANYILASLKDIFTPTYNRFCMHEVLFDDRFLDGTSVTTLDFAKAMIDEGYHPMTMYFPLVVHGALLIEPTETESKESLDQFIAMMRHLAIQAKNGNQDLFKTAPCLTPRRRLDETLAARKPILRWVPEANH